MHIVRSVLLQQTMSSSDMNSCLCCASVASQRRSKTVPLQVSTDGDVWVCCSNKSCLKKQSFRCVKNFCDSIRQARIPDHVIKSNKWTQLMMPIFDDIEKHPVQDMHIPFCMSCTNSSDLPSGMSSSLHKNLAIDPLPSIAIASNEEELCEDVTNDSEHLEIAPKRKKICSGREATSFDVMAYLSQYSVRQLLPPNYYYIANRHKGQMSPHFDGAFYVPSHKLIICSYANNKHLYVDFHALARSDYDGTPAIPHMVLSRSDAIALEQYYLQNQVEVPYISKTSYQTIKVSNVPMPESPSITRDWMVEYVAIQQKVPVKQISKENGRTNVPIDELLSCQIFSWRRYRRMAEFVIIAGDLDLDGGGKKLLCCRMQNLVNSAISNSDVKSLYTNILPFCGKKGYEMTRLSGSNGYTSDQTTKDLFSALHRNQYLLPNKAGACLVLQAPKWYWILYTKHSVKPGTQSVAVHKYSPPNRGGSVLLHGTIIDHFPIIGEFCYAKMIATLLFQKLNNSYLEIIHSKFAVGAINSELMSIEYSRRVFETSGSYAAMVRAHLLCNSMSLVTWSVGQHNDQFNKKGESIENKILFVLPSMETLPGRGGSFPKTEYVFALLDWQYQSRSVRSFYVNHANDMGIGPPSVTGSRQSLEYFFVHGGSSGGDWAHRFNEYGQGQIHFDKGTGRISQMD